MTNVILADVTENFSFYQYSIDCRDRRDQAIESLTRRKTLFDIALWDTVLRDMPRSEKEDLKRVVFFVGSYFFSARPIPGLEGSKLPLDILNGSSTDGDRFRCSQVFHFTAPHEITEDYDPRKPGEIAFDTRCGGCTKAFDNTNALLQHCRNTEHTPVYEPEGAKPANNQVFLSYVNSALSRALMERLKKWGRDYIDPKTGKTKDRNGNELGVTIYQAFSCEFGLTRTEEENRAKLSLTVDLRAKLMRSSSLLEVIYNGRNPNTTRLSYPEQDRALEEWKGQTVIYKVDKKTYTVVDLKFTESAASLMVEGLLVDGKPVSHAEYFEKRKKQVLQFPEATPMVTVLGRRNQHIFIPAELICGNELDKDVKKKLPQIASFDPEERNAAIASIKSFLVPGAQKTKNAGGLLPAIGIYMTSASLTAKAKVLPAPMLQAAGVTIPSNKENWTPVLSRANFNVSPREAVEYNVVIFHHPRLERGVRSVYERIRDSVNQFQSAYRFGREPTAVISAGDRENHWGAVQHFFSSKVPENVFVLDFTKPKGALDEAYPVVKQQLTAAGYLSQFVNFNTYSHDQPRDKKRSNIILQGVARQILQKSGVRLWWVSLPKSLPLPAVFVGVDVFHAPRKYNPQLGKRVAPGSCAAIIIQLVRPETENSHTVEIYSETFARAAGEEYGLQEALRTSVINALRAFDVNPMSCIVWRDGIGDSALDHLALEEIAGIRAGLKGRDMPRITDSDRQGGELVRMSEAGPDDVPLSYIVCQKRIATKFLTQNLPGHPDGKYGAPAGTLVQGIQGLHHNTFYVQGRAPPSSTPKPVRFIVVKQDGALRDSSLPDLTWSLCHDYPNWPGSIKVPSVCQMAHKLAELGGGFNDCGEQIDSKRFKNKIHFL